MRTWLGPLLTQLPLVVGSLEAQLAWRPVVSHFPPGTESAVVNSAASGREYQVWVALPRGYPDATEHYPVLYALDANGQFGTVTETARLLRFQELVPELVIVGVGYPVGHYLDVVGKRALDLTISVDRSFRLRPPFPQPEGTGGAPAFLGFLIEELIPLIESRYRVESEGRALIGHSFGGLFVTYHFFEDETHDSVVPATISRGLRYIYSSR